MKKMLIFAGLLLLSLLVQFEAERPTSAGPAAGSDPRPWAFSPPENVSHTADASQRARIALDGDGFLHLAWMEGEQNVANGPAYLRGRSGDWPAWEWAGPHDNPAYTNPALALDSQGTVHLVWTGGADSPYEILYASKTPTGTWSSPITLSQSALTSVYPSIAIDGQDRLWVAWGGESATMDWEVYVRSRPAGGTWEEVATISNRPEQDLEPAIAVDAAGVPHVVWRSNDDAWEIYTSTRVTSTWTPPLNLSANNIDSFSPRIAADDHQGNVFIVWQNQSRGLGYYQVLFRRWDGQQWEDTRQVSTSPSVAEHPAIAVDGCNVYVVWTDHRVPYADIFLSHSSDCGQIWSYNEPVSNSDRTSQYPDVVVQAGGHLHVVWQEGSWGNWDVYYSGGTASQVDPTPTVTPPVIPETPTPTTTGTPLPSGTPRPPTSPPSPGPSPTPTYTPTPLPRQRYLPLLRKSSPTCFRGPREVEPNDWPYQATGPLCSGHTYYALPDDADDFFRIETITGTVTVEMWSYAPGQHGQVLLYDEDWIWIEPAWDNNSFDGWYIEVELPAGTYYVRVYTAGGYSVEQDYCPRVTFAVP